MQAQFVHIQDADLAVLMPGDFGCVEVPAIPVVRADDGEGFFVQCALGIEFADKIGTMASLAFCKQTDEAVTGRWAAPTGAAVGDEHVGRFNQIAAKLEILLGPPFNAWHAVEPINADGPADEEPGFSVG